MFILTTIHLAFKTFTQNKVRSFLAMLGIIISVSSVCIFLAIGKGLELYIEQQFDELGSNNIFVSAGNTFDEESGGGFEDIANSLINSPFKLSDIRDLEKLRHVVDEVIPDNFQSDTISYRTTEETATILGTTSEAGEVFGLTPANGSFFTNSDVDQNERVVVLGYDIKQELFGEVDPVGKTVQVGSRNFTVGGWIEKKGGGFGASLDSYVYIPLTTFFDVYDTQVVLEMIVKTREDVDIEEAKKEVEDVLGRRLEEDEFSVYDQSTVLEATSSILGTVTLAVTGIAAVSMLVGGIGIMNIMLVTVTERTREIGLRKALGATPNTILAQFLIEAGLLSLCGGCIGLLIAFLFTLGIQSFFPAQITMTAVLIATGVSFGAGLVFGAAPARRAALLSPIEALTYE